MKGVSEYSRARVSKLQPTGRIQLVAYLCTPFKLKTVVVLQILSYIFKGLLKQEEEKKKKKGREERETERQGERERERKKGKLSCATHKA